MASLEKYHELENKSYYSLFRGNHAYKDEFKSEINTILTLQREPENPKDPHAACGHNRTERTSCGHIPLGLSKIVSSILKRINHREVVICGKRVRPCPH